MAPANPFVQQLIFQADSLHAVSRDVESQMKREGIPVLAATRDFLDLAGLGSSSGRNGSRRSPEPEPIVRPTPRFDDWQNNAAPIAEPKSFLDDPKPRQQDALTQLPPRQQDVPARPAAPFVDPPMSNAAPFVEPPMMRANSAPYLDDPILRNHISPFLDRPVESADVSPFVNEPTLRDFPRRGEPLFGPDSSLGGYQDTASSPFIEPPMPRADRAPVDEVPSTPFNLDVAPFPHLSDEEVHEPVSMFVEPIAAPEVVKDGTFADWTDHKLFHSNDHARAYDIDLTPDEDVFAVQAYLPQAQVAPAVEAVAQNPVAEVAAPKPVASSTPAFFPDATQAITVVPVEVSAATAKAADLAEALDRISSHYRNRAQVVGPQTPEHHADAALEPDVEPGPVVKRGIPGQIAHPYMVTVHNNLEIPKVPPYIWQAPEEIYDRDDAGMDPFHSWTNCRGNRHQLSLDLD